MATMIPKVILFILSSNSITYGLFLSSSNLRTLSNIGCYSVGKRAGFFFLFLAFLFGMGGENNLVQHRNHATRLLQDELVTDRQDKLALVGSMCKKLYTVYLNIHKAIRTS